MLQVRCRHCGARCLRDLAFLAGEGAEPGRAVRLFAAAEAIQEQMGAILPESMRSRMRQALAAAQTQLGETAFADAWAEGRAMSLAEATVFARDGSSSQRAL